MRSRKSRDLVLGSGWRAVASNSHNMIALKEYDIDKCLYGLNRLIGD
jgi:hypothetical protein